MAESLIIRLGSNATDSVHWLVWSAGTEEIIASGELPSAEQLVQLTEKSQNRNVVALVPACDVAFKQLNVPAKSARAMKLAAPYMLEDDLAQDVEQLFFAYGTPNVSDTNDNCFLAAVDHDQITLWLSWLREAGIHIQQMIPDALLLPEHESDWSCIELSGEMLIKRGAWSATTVEPMLFNALLSRWSEALDEDTSISLHHYSPLSLPELDQPVEPIVEPEELPLALLARNVAATKFNLLQGEFQIKTKRTSVTKTWLAAAGFAAFAFITTIAFKSASLWQINTQQAALEQQIIDVYKKAFPETKRVRVSTIRSQLKRKMAQVGGSENDNSFLVMLNEIQPAFSQVASLKPESLKFDGKRNEIRIQAVGESYQDFERFKSLLEKQQLTVSQGAQNNNNGSISGSFSISNNSRRSR